MPELPDISAYREALALRVEGTKLEHVRIASPFLLRTVEPPLAACENQRVLGVRRLGKRIVIALEGELFLVLHLMIAGRLRWLEKGANLPGKLGLAAFDFEPGTLVLTEAGTKRRASLHVLRGERALAAHDRGGIEVLECARGEFEAALVRENHTLKRALTDPRLFSGIGNAYSDEILHRAQLSPLQWTARLDADERGRLFEATRAVLGEWTAKLVGEARMRWPEKVTAFREEMAVHGKFGKACPVCGEKVQRIVYAENECNYCARCQTGGRLLADRALSKLLHGDWPRTLEELEELYHGRPGINPA
jgi:formamidopyrimidine-DNA glycosylase